MSRRWTGRQPLATAAQVAEIQRRYELFAANHPTRIAAELGLSAKYVRRVGSGRGPKRFGGLGSP